MTQVSDTDLSIIIPVYQVSEELLLRCLKSVQEIQDLRKEVILVADGPDQEVCSNPAIQAFAGEAEFKISFYEKQHEGVSAATTHFKYSLISISLTQSSSDTYTLTVPLSIGLCPSPLPPINQTIASGKSNVIKMIITTTKSIFFTPKSPF